MRWLIFFLLPLSLQVLSAEPDTLSRIGAQMEQYPVVRAEFIQNKQMPALKRPLVTSGRLVFSRRHGVLWQIEQPYRMSYVLGEERIVEITGQNRGPHPRAWASRRTGARAGGQSVPRHARRKYVGLARTLRGTRAGRARQMGN